MSADAGKYKTGSELWPTESYFEDRRDLFVNGEGIEIHFQPAAHTNGDSMVYFRRSDVIVTGDIFTPQRYPVFDIESGGSINGVIVVTIVRDRVQDALKKNMTLDQVKAARLTRDYDGIYATPEYSVDMFVDAVYRRLASAMRRSDEIRRMCADRQRVNARLDGAVAGCPARRRTGARPAGSAADSESRGSVRPGEGQSQRRGMQRVRGCGYHSKPDAHAHHLAGRKDAANRHGRRRTDAGTVLRRRGAANGGRTWQGYSIAKWYKQPQAAGLGFGGGGRGVAGGNLRVVTTSMKAGYLRKNGVPYSENAVLTEYVNRHDEPNGDQWLMFTSVVEDPQYLDQPFILSTSFKKEPDGSKCHPTRCKIDPPRN